MASLIKILNSDDVTRKKLRHIVELLQHTLEILFICFLGKILLRKFIKFLKYKF